MTFDLQKIIESKRKFRQELAALPIAEKLRVLDALRERHCAINPEPQLPPARSLPKNSG